MGEEQQALRRRALRQEQPKQASGQPQFQQISLQRVPAREEMIGTLWTTWLQGFCVKSTAKRVLYKLARFVELEEDV